MRSFGRTSLVCLFGFLSIALPAQQTVPATPIVQDTVYLQEVSKRIATREPLTAVAAVEGAVFAGSSKGLYQLFENGLGPVTAVNAAVHRLVADGKSAWALTSTGLFRGDAIQWQKLSNERFTDLVLFRGETILASGRKLYRWTNGIAQPLTTNEAPFDIHRMVSHCETLYLTAPGRVTFVERGRFGGRASAARWSRW